MRKAKTCQNSQIFDKNKLKIEVLLDTKQKQSYSIEKQNYIINLVFLAVTQCFEGRVINFNFISHYYIGLGTQSRNLKERSHKSNQAEKLKQPNITKKKNCRVSVI